MRNKQGFKRSHSGILKRRRQRIQRLTLRMCDRGLLDAIVSLALTYDTLGTQMEISSLLDESVLCAAFFRFIRQKTRDQYEAAEWFHVFDLPPVSVSCLLY